VLHSITTAVAHQFTKSARAKGEDYAAMGVVRIESGSPDQVRAVVVGREPYRVSIARRTDGKAGFTVTCTCPYYDQEFAPCKHLWATFVVAERDGFLRTNADDSARADFELIEPELVEPTAAVAVGSRVLTRADRADVSERMRAYWAARHGRVQGRRAPASRPDPGSLALANLEAHLQARQSDSPAAFRYASGELIYVFRLPDANDLEGMLLKVMTRTRKKTGEWAKPKVARLSGTDIARAPDPDRGILATLSGAIRATPAGYYYTSADASQEATFNLPQALVPDTVPVIVKTNRAFLEIRKPPPLPPSGPHPYYWAPPEEVEWFPLKWDDGAPWRFEPQFVETLTGWRVSGELVRGDERLALNGLSAVDRWFLWTRERVARADLLSVAPLLHAMLPKGGIEIIKRDSPRLALVLGQLNIPDAHVPPALRVEQVDVAPAPQLRLDRISPADARLQATVSFAYGTSVVPLSAAPTFFDADKRRLIRRRPDEERAAITQLLEHGVRQGWDPYERQPRFELHARQVSTLVAALIAKGWHVEAEGRAYRTASGVRFSVASGIDWFDLEASVDFGGATVPLSDALAALERRDTTIRLGDGSTGLLPEDWLRRYLPLAAAAESADGRLRFRRPQAALLDALLADAARQATVDLDAGFHRARDELAQLAVVGAIDPPDAFYGTLREYQREGLAWLQALQRGRIGGCLADDMGLGKTVMVLALLLWRREQGDRDTRPSAVVMPRSLVHNWIAEAARFAPALSILDYSTSARNKTPDFSAIDVVLLTYGTLRQDVVRLKDVEFDYVILDEAQGIKNEHSASAKAARLLRARHRLALTGTPLENHLGELWSIFEFLNPGVLGRSTLFQRAVSATVEERGTIDLVTRGLRPFILRRTKQQVASELPAKTEATITCDLSPLERSLYEGLRLHYRESVLRRVERDGVTRSRMHILEALLRLRQAACHPALVDHTRPYPSSAKLDVLLARAHEVIAERHKALVFSQFTTLLGLVRRQLDAQNIAYEYLDGRTRDREKRIARFQEDPDCRLFLISLKAGGFGLNLTAAEYVFLLDPWWNPAVEAQAIDRTHRIGQTHEVFAYRLVAGDTIEAKILELQQRKRQLADAILGAAAGGLKHLDSADLDLLLS
jgi:superfamily II DNA or RNA helicase